MKVGHYVNEKMEGPYLIPIPEFRRSMIRTETLHEEDYREGMSDQLLEIDLSDKLMGFGDRVYPVAAGRDGTTPQGEFVIAEKWENPYWKMEGNLYLPTGSNPIGKYLIILADPETGVKISGSIHRRATYPQKTQRFSCGVKTNGCIRMRVGDLKIFFREVELGASVLIYE